MKQTLDSPTRALTPFSCAALVTIALGIFARFWRLGFPAQFSFDEHHFVENARNYLHGKPDWNDHPPLGKLTMASSIELWGDSAFAWRFVSAVVGVATIGVAFALARSLFRHDSPSRRNDVALLAGAVVAADGFCIAYSRTALIDGQLTFFALAAVLVATLSTSAAGWLAVGCVVGLAAGVKFSGICVGLPLFFLLVTRLSGGARFAAAGLALVGFASTYSAQWILGLVLSGKFESVSQVVSETARLYEHHAVLTQMDNPWVSYWYTWFVPKKPIVLYRLPDHDLIRMSTSLGNPFSWWCVGGAAVVGAGISLRQAVALVARRRDGGDSSTSSTEGWRAALDTHSSALIVPFLGWLGFLAPWILTKRDSYIYHYLPAYTFGLILAAGLVVELGRVVHAKAHYYFLLIAFVVSAFYAPIWIGAPLSAKAASDRALLRSWQ